MKKVIILIFLLISSCTDNLEEDMRVFAALQNIKQVEIITTENNLGYCWFSRPRSISAGGETAIGVVGDFGTGYRSGLVKIDESDNSFVGVPLSTFVREDDHEEAAFLQRSFDDKIIAAYDEHNQEFKLRWRISTNANDLTSWDTEKTITIANKTSYSSLYECSNGEIFYFYRAGLGNSAHGWSYVKSTDNGENFSTSETWLTDSTDDRGYVVINVDPNNTDILHFLGSRNHPNNPQSSTNTDPGVWHGIFDLSTETWTNSSGIVYASRPINFRTQATTIASYTIPESCWIEDIAVDLTTGYPRVTWYYTPDVINDLGELKYRYYSEFNGTSWTSPYLMHTISTEFHESDAYTNPPVSEGMYSGSSRFNSNNPNIIWLSKEVNGLYGKKLEIFKVTRNGLNNFSYQQITTNSQKHQWRPNVIEDADSSYDAYWLEINTYNDYIDFDNSLKVIKK